MNTITFSHFYSKLTQLERNEDGQIEVRLLDVIPIRLQDLSPAFLVYDTDNGTYPLPKRGEYLMLIFAKNASNIFTTLRRKTPEKEKYYRGRVGQIFAVNIQAALRQKEG